jgi:site-specific DNA-methyltransferase (cytosine-N4-specific)
MADRRSFKTDESFPETKLLADAGSFYRPKLRPSGHDISANFANNNGGAIPSNLLQIPNTESNSPYQRHCATVGVKPHPARFPEKLPTFFIPSLAHRMGEGGRRPGEGGGGSVGRLTDPGDTVLDIFAGSNTTGSAAEKLDRRWLAFEKDRTYLASSAFRFVDEPPPEQLAMLWSQLGSHDLSVAINLRQREFVLMGAPAACKDKPKAR